MNSEAFADFFYTTIFSQLKGLYNAAPRNPAVAEALQDEAKLRYLVSGAAADYLNRCYVSLIRRDDEYVTRTFDEICSGGHSQVCAIIVLSQYILEFYKTAPLGALDKTTQDSFLQSLKKMLEPMRTVARNVCIKANVSHECRGTDIRTCDPTKPLIEVTYE